MPWFPWDAPVLHLVLLALALGWRLVSGASDPLYERLDDAVVGLHERLGGWAAALLPLAYLALLSLPRVGVLPALCGLVWALESEARAEAEEAGMLAPLALALGGVTGLFALALLRRLDGQGLIDRSHRGLHAVEAGLQAVLGRPWPAWLAVALGLLWAVLD